MSRPDGEFEQVDCGCGMGDRCQNDDYLRDLSFPLPPHDRITVEYVRKDALLHVGWMGPYGIVPGGLDVEPNPNWRPLYMLAEGAEQP